MKVLGRCKDCGHDLDGAHPYGVGFDPDYWLAYQGGPVRCQDCDAGVCTPRAWQHGQ